MTKLMFVDTAGWMALVDGADPAHDATCRERDLWIEQGGLFVTSDHVVDETLTLIRVRIDLDAASRWWTLVEGSQRVRIEWSTPERAAHARTTFFGWKDKTFSCTDCTSFALMRELKIRVALTTDDHFRQAGFEVRPGA